MTPPSSSSGSPASSIEPALRSYSAALSQFIIDDLFIPLREASSSDDIGVNSADDSDEDKIFFTVEETRSLVREINKAVETLDKLTMTPSTHRPKRRPPPLILDKTNSGRQSHYPSVITQGWAEVIHGFGFPEIDPDLAAINAAIAELEAANRRVSIKAGSAAT